MKDGGYTAPSLAAECSLSRSLIEKLMSNESKRPSSPVVAKIEETLSVRLWSSPSEFKRRRAREKFEKHVTSIAKLEGVDNDTARAIARERFPSLDEKNPTPLKEPLCPKKTV
jgi:transcriptional regulator with XRE-family HTH domain